MTRISIEDIKDKLADAVQAKQQWAAMAGGTVAVWAEAANGVVLCVTDGDCDGDTFAPEGGHVDVNSFAIGKYSNVDSYMDGDMYGSLDIVPADAALDALVSKARDLVAD